MTCIPTRHDDTVLAGVKAKPSGWQCRGVSACVDASSVT